MVLLSFHKRADPAPKPQPQQPPPFEFHSSWGGQGDGPGKLNAPVAFATDTQGNLYFTDTAGFVHKFEATGTPLLSFEDARFRHASGITVDRGGAIYVADAQHGMILVFFPDGTFLRAMHMRPQPNVTGPVGITVDDQGNLYLPGGARSAILKFDDRGRPAKYGGMAPSAPAADGLPSAVAAAPDGSVFAAFADPGHIVKYSSDGSQTVSWNVAENPGASDAITGLAVNEGFVFAAVSPAPRIRVWTLDGQHNLDSDLEGRLDGIAAPQIAVTAKNQLCVFDPASRRVFVFRIHF